MKIALLNKISTKGTDLLTKDYSITENDNEANAILVRSAKMHDMEFADGLLAIARAGAGTNNIPLEKCAEKGIVVFNTPGANANAVKELVLGSLFLSARNVIPAITWAKTLKGDDVASVVEKNKSSFAGSELLGKTLAVVGLGAIGVLVANSAETLGMKVVGYDPYISVENAHSLSRTIKIYNELDKMLPLADYITLHIPAIKETENMISKKEFDVIKDGTILLNFSRDIVVNEKDLLSALDKKLKLYISDFIDAKLVEHEKVIPIPHLGASTAEAEENCAVMAVKQVMNYIENGNIINSVNYPNVDAGEIETPSRVTIMHKNIPTIINKLTSLFADKGININNMIDKSKGDLAYAIMDIDSKVDEKMVVDTFNFEGIIKVRVLNK